MFCDLCFQEIDGYCEFCDEWYCQTCEVHECEATVDDEENDFDLPYIEDETPFGIALDGGEGEA